MGRKRTFRRKKYKPLSSVNQEKKNGLPVQQRDGGGMVEVMDAELSQAEVAETVSTQEGKGLPSREWILTAMAFWGIVLLGVVLRFWGLGDKPLHHDESVHGYFAWQLMKNLQNYHYQPIWHGPFQFNIIALVYKISQLLGAPDHGVNTTTVRIAAAILGTVIVGLPFFMRDYLGKLEAWLACFLLAISPSMVYFSRFAREDIYMACFTLLLVAAVGRYVRTRKGFWLAIAASAFSLSYATKEATFLTIAVFGSFLGAVVMWEIGLKWSVRPSVRSGRKSVRALLARYLPKTGSPITLLLYFLILLPIAKGVLGELKNLSIYINTPRYTNTANSFELSLKNDTATILPWLGILLAIYVFSIIIREMMDVLPQSGRRGLAARVNPKRQPLLDSIVSMPWIHWFTAIVCAFLIFLLLFTVYFTRVKQGIGDGVWEGLYYWIQQQQLARGGQPWYYYLMLFPLYEQIGVVFGIVGIAVCLCRPSYFRLFLVYWFIGNIFIYSWAGEKMPWLMIHITMPLMLLAAIGLQPIVHTLRDAITDALKRVRTSLGAKAQDMSPDLSGEKIGTRFSASARASASVLSVPVTLFLLILTLQNMFQVTYVHAADGPHEMMVYVQTTTDINTVMAKIDALDRKVDGGRHHLHIGAMNGADSPFDWYLRDYTNVCYGFPTACSDPKPAVIISAVDSVRSSQTTYATPTANGKQPDYLFKRYHLRTWWDEGYKPPSCVPSPRDSCQGQPSWGGVGLFLWLSYGDYPPSSHAPFDLGRAIKNVWLWWWQRKPIGSTMGTTDMGLLIRKDLRMLP
ncbi:MAG TPA: flippase activity-associated protein Agl23 [Ktedonobacteraceae bacterium]|nr:flippase activity-associated protein Agl23 [Ktedonobacteraceae bacterium]